MSNLLKMLEQGLHSRSGPVRKGCALALQAPKKLAQTRAQAADYAARPPVLANSFPKSGTHLLDQIVAALPHRRNFGSFLASLTSSFQYRRRTAEATCRFIEGVVPGEIVRGHLWYASAAAEALQAKNAVHYLIVRDPRDVVISEAHYLRSLNPWHKLHPYFRSAGSTDEAISIAIEGLPAKEPDYPNIGRRLALFEPWFDDPNVCLVRFEDLLSQECDATLQRMIEFYGGHSARVDDAEKLLVEMKAKMAPGKSHTFRSGKAGGWKESLTAAHRERFKQVAQDALVRLGFEADDNW
jgi:hypothetical protein